MTCDWIIIAELCLSSADWIFSPLKQNKTKKQSSISLQPHHCTGHSEAVQLGKVLLLYHLERLAQKQGYGIVQESSTFSSAPVWAQPLMQLPFAQNVETAAAATQEPQYVYSVARTLYFQGMIILHAQ